MTPGLSIARNGNADDPLLAERKEQEEKIFTRVETPARLRRFPYRIEERGDSVSDEQKEPAVYCACGAQWHGRWVAKAAKTILWHQERWKSHSSTCWSVPHDYFAKHHKCGCEGCVAQRRSKRVRRSVIAISVTKAEKATIVASAKAAGLSPSAWLLSAALITRALEDDSACDAVGQPSDLH